MVASAICPTTTCWPFEYCASTWPPFARPTLTRFAAGDPFCATAEVAELCANCVRRGEPLLNRLQLTLMSDAPSVRPLIGIAIGGSVAAGVFRFPFESNVSLPVTGGNAPPVTSALGTVIE